MANRFKYHSTDSGFCRVYLTTRNDKGQRLLYCIQGTHAGNAEFYRCTVDGEPWYSCAPKGHDWGLIDLPEPDGDADLIMARDFIASKLEAAHG